MGVLEKDSGRINRLSMVAALLCFSNILIIFAEYLDQIEMIDVYVLRIGLVVVNMIIVFYYQRKEMFKFLFLVALFILLQFIFMNGMFDVFEQKNNLGLGSGFAMTFMSGVCSKLIVAVQLIIAMKVMNTSEVNRSIAVGDLNHMVGGVRWLGIEEGWISWGRMAAISGPLIAMGTVIFSSLGLWNSFNTFSFSSLLKSSLWIMLFAIVNSFVEGIIFRAVIVETLPANIGRKYILLGSAAVFGLYHLNGIPGGLVGVIASTALGWFLAKSYYETNGFLASWLIHFTQDLAIFSLIALTGNYA